MVTRTPLLPPLQPAWIPSLMHTFFLELYIKNACELSDKNIVPATRNGEMRLYETYIKMYSI